MESGAAIAAEVLLRPAHDSDWNAIAELHAASWRATYRGALSASYLASRVLDDRRALWEKRFDDPEPGQHIVVAVRGKTLLGFACAQVQLDPDWGSLLDNLHVSAAAQRAGLGTRLLRAVSRHCATQAPRADLYLWVVQRNHGAQQFYFANGAQNVGADVWDAPDGRQVATFRLAWRAGHLPVAHD